MSWQGANVVRRKRSVSSPDRQRRSSETLEASLNRLSKSYSAVLECVGALHRAKQEAQQQDIHFSSIQHVAQTARKTLERGILVDPLVRPLAPRLMQIWHEWSTQTETKSERSQIWSWVPRNLTNQQSPVLTSGAHQKTVQKLAYLALSNYADLLLSGCACHGHVLCRETILDRGVVSSLGSSSMGQISCCWIFGETEQQDLGQHSAACKKEIEHDTVRLAMVAYLDAVHLDGSDPVAWFKLAVAARRLENVENLESGERGYRPRRYRRVEQFALESAQACWLTQHRPPNRTIVRAWNEWQKDHSIEAPIPEGLDILHEPPKQNVLELSLQRYSWAVLGRNLARACREGTGFRQIPLARDNPSNVKISVNPVIRISISPLLTLPSLVLGVIIAHLDDASVARLECSCRALSVAVIAARAKADLAGLKEQKQTNAAPDSEPAPMETDEAHQAPNSTNYKAGEKNEQPAAPKKKDRSAVQASRVSKRLLTKIESSDKRAERGSRRSSLEYCLIGAVNGFPPDSKEYQEQIQSYTKLPSSPHRHLDSRQGEEMHVENAASGEGGRGEAQERVSPTSLTMFVQDLSARSPTPLQALFQFLSHVSVHVDEVYTCESMSTILSTCIMDIFELLKLRVRFRESVPCWFENEAMDVGLSQVQIFAVDLLHAEFRLKRCEREDSLDSSLEGDVSFLGLVLPSLLAFVDKGDGTGLSARSWVGLKARCFWLASSFLLWHARVVQNASEVRDVENECLIHVEKIVSVLDGNDEVRTPHLEGIGRSGLYWTCLSRANIESFRTEIQASSVVLVAQDQFIDALSKLESSSNSASGCREAFKPIGDALLKRYKSPANGPKANQVELIDEFLSLQGQFLIDLPIANSHEMTDWFESILPVSPPKMEAIHSLESPSILSILAICLSFRSTEGSLELFDVLVNLIQMLGDLRDHLMVSSISTPEDPNEAMSDDDISLDSDDESVSPSRNDRRDPLKLYSRLLALFLTSLTRLVNTDCQDGFLKEEKICSVVNTSFKFSSDTAESNSKILVNKNETTEDVLVLAALSGFLDSIRSKLNNEPENILVDRLHARNLVRVLVTHQQSLQELSKMEKGSTRKTWLVRGSVQFLSRACIDLGKLLFSYPCETSGKTISRSVLLTKMNDAIPALCQTLVWLFNVCCRQEDGALRFLPVSVARELRIPVAVAVVSLCGSGVFTKEATLLTEDQTPKDVSLTDVVDSDASAAECASEEDHLYEEMMRVVFLATQCIRLVFAALEDDEFCFRGDGTTAARDDVSLIQISEYVLNLFADVLLKNPNSQDSDIDNEHPLWGDYSFGLRSIGSNIDKLLHRVYKFSYGFNLAHVGEPKEGQLASEDTKPIMKPSTPEAAAQLYRCMMRACGHGRKSPPKAALLTITAALPDVRETEQSRTIKSFLFSTQPSLEFSKERIASLVHQSSGWEMPFERLESFLSNMDSRRLSKQESEIVRMGMSSLFAQGSLPTFDGMVNKDSRLQTQQAESELSNRFNAILYSLTHDNAADCEGWYRFSQICLVKANMIADRLGMSNGYSRARDFTCVPRKLMRDMGVPFTDLMDNQKREMIMARNKEHWSPSLGSSFQLYIDHSWSSFDSLKVLQRKVGDDCTEIYKRNGETSGLQTWNEIVGLYTEEKLTLWQQGWGGLFVRALQTIATRSMCFALFILQKGIGISDTTRRSSLIAEICETLGTSLYAELSGSQMYGYPLRAMTSNEKRNVAESALECYKLAVVEEERGDGKKPDGKKKKDEQNQIQMTWDLHFMVGKCHEKIASSFSGERFSDEGVRRYEEAMSLAFKSYAASLLQAQGLDKDGDLIVEQQGGSAHGYVEILYRMQATRLKCLLSALKHCDTEREEAELEALRLVEPFPYTPSQEDISATATVRDRVWSVAVDVVNAMVHCRSRHSCFHRSVYRHAQALMWAPVLCEPELAKKEGSFGVVPASKASSMRGLNSDSAVESAVVAMRALFDKKRTQLCAAWVTTPSVGSDTPFQRINMDSRKYDALRGKYIVAYLKCLEISNKQEDLETFLRWTTTCPRDLPSFFAASASSGGKAPETTHIYDSLVPRPQILSSWFFLTSVKREANAALASVILHEGKAKKAPRDAKELENMLKLAYSCFLRLNCEPSLLSKPHIRQSAGIKPIADALVAVHSKLTKNQKTNYASSDWSMVRQHSLEIEAVLQKCNALFPALSGSFLTTKKNPKKKKGGSKTTGTDQVIGSKRKEPDGSFTVLKQFDAVIPEGLSEGDVFMTEVQTGDKVKKIKLTVPPGEANSLRFSLRVPIEAASNVPLPSDAPPETQTPSSEAPKPETAPNTAGTTQTVPPEPATDLTSAQASIDATPEEPLDQEAIQSFPEHEPDSEDGAKCPPQAEEMDTTEGRQGSEVAD